MIHAIVFFICLVWMGAKGYAVEFLHTVQHVLESPFRSRGNTNSHEAECPVDFDKNETPPNFEMDTYSVHFHHVNSECDFLMNGVEQKSFHYLFSPNSTDVYAKFFIGKGNICSREFYFYDEEGKIIQKKVDDGSSVNRDDLTGVTRSNITKFYYSSSDAEEIYFPTIVEEFCLDLTSFQEKLLEKTINQYDSQKRMLQQDIYDAQESYCYSVYKIYDEIGLLNIIEDTKGNVSENSYDANGNLIAIFSKNSKGVEKTIVFAYDALNRLVQSQEIDQRNRPVIVEFKYVDLEYHSGVLDTFCHEATQEYGGLLGHKVNKISTLPEAVCEEGYNLDQNLMSTEIKDQPAGKNSRWQDIANLGANYIQQISSSMDALKERIDKNLSYTSHIKPQINEIVEKVFGRLTLLMMGFYEHDCVVGTRGKGEISDKVRLTFVNGILSTHADVAYSADIISLTHGGVNVHYLFRPTQGWTWDMLNAAAIRLGYVSPQALLLAQLWKDLIVEMGGVGSGGLIYHYAHSMGAAETVTAKTLLSSEEQKMIQVISFGSPIMIRNEGFKDVMNYVSLRDGVCYLDPIGYVRGLMSWQTNIVFLGDYKGIPIIDHTIHSVSYKSLLKELGQQFVDIYKWKEIKI